MLNDSQRTSLRITLQMLDEKMKGIEAILEKPEEARIMYEVRNDLPLVVHDQLPIKIEALKAIVRELRDTLDLRREILPASRQLFKGLPYLWEILEEALSKRLGRYGDVDERLAPVLDPQIARLETIIIEMEDLITGPQRS